MWSSVRLLVVAALGAAVPPLAGEDDARTRQTAIVNRCGSGRDV